MKENGLPMKILPSKSLHRKVYYKKYNCSMLLNAVSVQKYSLTPTFSILVELSIKYSNKKMEIR
jgi:uncharacterized protein Usg